MTAANPAPEDLTSVYMTKAREAAERVRAFLTACRATPGVDGMGIAGAEGADGTMHHLTEDDLSTGLDERDALAARVAELEAEREGRLAQAYTSGWYDAIEAYRGPGWAEREAGWRKYREAVRAEATATDATDTKTGD